MSEGEKESATRVGWSADRSCGVENSSLGSFRAKSVEIVACPGPVSAEAVLIRWGSNCGGFLSGMRSSGDSSLTLMAGEDSFLMTFVEIWENGWRLEMVCLLRGGGANFAVVL